MVEGGGADWQLRRGGRPALVGSGGSGSGDAMCLYRLPVVGGSPAAIKVHRWCSGGGALGGDHEEDAIVGRGFAGGKRRFPIHEISGVIRFVLGRI